MRLEYLPLRICKEWRPAAISASTVAPWSIDPTDVPSTEMSNLPRRSSIPKAARVTLSVADTSHLLSPAAPYGRSAGSPVAPVVPWPQSADELSSAWSEAVPRRRLHSRLLVAAVPAGPLMSAPRPEGCPTGGSRRAAIRASLRKARSLARRGREPVSCMSAIDFAAQSVVTLYCKVMRREPQ